MRTGLERILRATREYQPTNRREDNITRRRRFTSCPLSMPAQIDEKLETESCRPLTFYQPYQR